MATLNVPSPYATIADAVAAAMAGDSIVIDATYAGNETVDVGKDNLTFTAPASVTGIALHATAGVSSIRLGGASPISVSCDTGGSIDVYGNSGANKIETGSSTGGNLDLGDGDDVFETGSLGNFFVKFGGGNDRLVLDYSSSEAAIVNPGEIVVDGRTRITISDPENLEFLKVNTGSRGDSFSLDAARVEVNSGEGSDNIYVQQSRAGTIDAGDGTDYLYCYDSLGSIAISNVEGLVLLSGSTSLSLAQLNAVQDLFYNSFARLGFDLTGAGGAYDFGAQITDSTAVSVNAQSVTSGVKLRATANADILTGSSFADTLKGAAGNDTITGGGGVDELNGGAGNDRFTLNGAKGLVDGGADIDTVVSGNLGNYVFSNVEILDTASVKATAAQLSAFSTIMNSANSLGELEFYLRGAGGSIDFATRVGAGYSLYVSAEDAYAGVNVKGGVLDDIIRGSSFNDTLDGGFGVDVLFGGLGDDIYYTDGDDAVAETGNAGVDTVYSSGSYTLAENVENLVLSGTGAIDGKGNNGANRIIGNDAANDIDGGLGADRMRGLGGDDRYTVDDAGDVVVEASGGGVDIVRASVTHALAANVENLQLTGTGAIDGFGNGLANTIIGNDAANVLGGAAGADRLRGNDGADTFVFAHLDAADALLDFSHVDDTIRLDATVFTTIGVGTLSADAFKDIGVPGARVDADDRIIYNRATGALFYDADGSGAGARIKIANLNNLEVVTHDDFVIA